MGGDEGQEIVVSVVGNDCPEQPPGLGCRQEGLHGGTHSSPGIAGTGGQRAVDHGQESLGLTGHVCLDQALAGPELVVEGLAAHASRSGYVNHADVGPWSVREKGADPGRQ